MRIATGTHKQRYREGRTALCASTLLCVRPPQTFNPVQTTCWRHASRWHISDVEVPLRASQKLQVQHHTAIKCGAARDLRTMKLPKMKICAPTTAQSKQRTRRSKALWKGHHKSCRTTAAINLRFRRPLFGTSLVQYLHHAPSTFQIFESKLTTGTRFTACARATACDTELHHIPLPRSTLHRTTNNSLQAILRRTAASTNVSSTLPHQCRCARHRGSFTASNRKEDNQIRARSSSKCRPSN